MVFFFHDTRHSIHTAWVLLHYSSCQTNNTNTNTHNCLYSTKCANPLSSLSASECLLKHEKCTWTQHKCWHALGWQTISLNDVHAKTFIYFSFLFSDYFFFFFLNRIIHHIWLRVCVLKNNVEYIKKGWIRSFYISNITFGNKINIRPKIRLKDQALNEKHSCKPLALLTYSFVRSFVLSFFQFSNHVSDFTIDLPLENSAMRNQHEKIEC